jgi:hypothetical protein
MVSKAHDGCGAMPANITPSPRHGLDESFEELERRLPEAAMLRDGDKCVMSGHNKMDDFLEAA